MEGVVGIDQPRGLALIKLQQDAGVPLVLADISELEIGEDVYAFAHHIVAFARAAGYARSVLNRFGIDINSAENGVFLQSTLHASLHTVKYYKAVNRVLSHAQTKEEVVQALELIKTSLANGMERFQTRNMTNVFRLDSDTGFRSLLPPEDNAFLDISRQFDGTRIGGAWVPLTVEYDPDSPDIPISDFPTLTLPHIPVFSRRAVETLKLLLKANGELLPLNTPDGAEFFAFNVTSVVSAMSPKSQIVYYSTGRILDVKQYVLDETRLTDAAIFKLPETVLMDVFVNDEFVALVESANLGGFSFESVAVE